MKWLTFEPLKARLVRTRLRMRPNKKDKILCETQNGKSAWVEKEEVQLRVGAYGILAKDNKVLVIQAHLSLWEFPGGSPEEGESLLNALKREFKEETGIELEPKRLILERESFYSTPSGRAFHSFQHFFLVEQTGGGIDKLSQNITPPIWMSVDDLNPENMNRGAHIALKAFQDHPQITHFTNGSNPIPLE